MPEIWKPVPGYEGKYEVSDQGRVRSLDRNITYRDGRTRFYPGQILKQYMVVSEDGQKYWSIRITKAGKNYRVHSLVMRAFVGDPAPGQIVRHLDGNGLNNNLHNLAYGTNAQNQIDIYGYGGTPGLGKLKPEDGAEIVKLHEAGFSYSQIMKVFPVSKSTVARVVHGQFNWAERGIMNG